MDGDSAGIGSLARPKGTLLASFRDLFLVALAAVLPLSACGCSSPRQWWANGLKVGPNYARPRAPVAPSWVDAGDPRVKSEPAQDCAWWLVFNDPHLNGFVDTAYRQNLDLRAAGTRIIEARAQRNIAVGNLFPQSQSALAAYAHAQITKNIALPLPNVFNVWATGFNASWELDFWGRYRRSVESANATLDASVESYGETLVMLLSEVATSYVQMRAFEQRLVYARQNVEIQSGSLRLAEQRFRNGLATELDVRQARTSLAQTESTIPPLEAGRRQAANSLCVLMGMPVNDLANQLPSAPIPIAPPEVAVGIPADLLRRRPDVRQAERQVAAQSAQIGVAEADLYPRLSLNGFVGVASNDIRDLFARGSFTGFVIPNLQWNVLNYGRIANNIVAQDARLQTVALEYQQAALNAGREVEDALVRFLQSQQQAARLAESVQEARRSVELVLMQFEAGVTDFNRVFNTQTVLVSQQDQLAVTRGDIATNLIEVYRALGGGWHCFCHGCGMPCAREVAVSPPTQAEEVPAPSHAK
ncbi:MAG: efflux transporter outer membrane subunit [Planctomycetia bacterium]|nr:efflux transporter outer membrane subunit [Planctomycetia bacterium]